MIGRGPFRGHWRLIFVLLNFKSSVICEESSELSQIKLIQQLLEPSLATTCGIYYIFIYVFHKSTSSVTGWLQLRSVVWFKLNCQHFQTILLAFYRIFSECLENQLPMWWVDFSCGEWSESNWIKSISRHFETSLAATSRI